ncbi:MAG TPA: conjugal transfer protein [Conexibacter sp.]|nr:conjugal transfer protein [Conexibacter sp.]
MKAPRQQLTSLRAQRLRALAPRVLVLAVVAVVGVNGLRAIFAGAPAPAVDAAPAHMTGASADVEGYAEAFARAYLTWEADDPDARTAALAAFLGERDADGGMRPADDTTQRVRWTSVAALEARRDRTLVTVAAATDDGMLHLSVPVARGARGLQVVDYPALVGAPRADRDTRLATPHEWEVADAGLETVVQRALENYFGHADANLLADLTPTATVALPDQRLELQALDALTWVVPDRRVAARVRATDEAGSELTLRYELAVQRTDRWYVDAIHTTPTPEEATP